MKKLLLRLRRALYNFLDRRRPHVTRRPEWWCAALLVLTASTAPAQSITCTNVVNGVRVSKIVCDAREKSGVSSEVFRGIIAREFRPVHLEVSPWNDTPQLVRDVFWPFLGPPPLTRDPSPGRFYYPVDAYGRPFRQHEGRRR